MIIFPVASMGLPLKNCPSVDLDFSSVVECSANCKDIGVDIQFKAKENKSMVLLTQTKLSDGKKRSSVLKNCQIFDSKNWVCKRNRSNHDLGIVWNTTHKMADGAYMYFDDYLSIVNKNETYTRQCAK